MKFFKAFIVPVSFLVSYSASASYVDIVNGKIENKLNATKMTLCQILDTVQEDAFYSPLSQEILYCKNDVVYEEYNIGSICFGKELPNETKELSNEKTVDLETYFDEKNKVVFGFKTGFYSPGIFKLVNYSDYCDKSVSAQYSNQSVSAQYSNQREMLLLKHVINSFEQRYAFKKTEGKEIIFDVLNQNNQSKLDDKCKNIKLYSLGIKCIHDQLHDGHSQYYFTKTKKNLSYSTIEGKEYKDLSGDYKAPLSNENLEEVIFGMTDEGNELPKIKGLINEEGVDQTSVLHNQGISALTEIKLNKNHKYFSSHFTDSYVKEVLDLGKFDKLPKIGYLNVYSFGASSEENILEFKKEIDDLLHEMEQDTDALVLDVRLNGGGKVTKAIYLAQRFAYSEEEYQIGTFKTEQCGYSAQKCEPIFSHTLTSTSSGQHYTKPVIVLISYGTQSAADYFAVVMKKLSDLTNYVKVLGTKTSSVYSVITGLILPNNDKYSLSTQRVYFDHEMLERDAEGVSKGVIPNIEVKEDIFTDFYTSKGKTFRKSLEQLAIMMNSSSLEQPTHLD
tara:strand:- start:3043 stop:4725 length:1683 start_codon:yes stop_codon:yes gene_type:complete